MRYTLLLTFVSLIAISSQLAVENKPVKPWIIQYDIIMTRLEICAAMVPEASKLIDKVTEIMQNIQNTLLAEAYIRESKLPGSVIRLPERVTIYYKNIDEFDYAFNTMRKILGYIDGIIDFKQGNYYLLGSRYASSIAYDIRDLLSTVGYLKPPPEDYIT
jgi:hypothetical protein